MESSKYVVYTRELDNAPYQVMFVKEKGPEVTFFNQYNTVILIGFIFDFVYCSYNGNADCEEALETIRTIKCVCKKDDFG